MFLQGGWGYRRGLLLRACTCVTTPTLSVFGWGTSLVIGIEPFPDRDPILGCPLSPRWISRAKTVRSIAINFNQRHFKNNTFFTIRRQTIIQPEKYSQWWIQDLTREGWANQPHGAGSLTYCLAKCLPKTAWKWKKLEQMVERGTRVPSALPWIRQWYWVFGNLLSLHDITICLKYDI